ncbi:hypothetical protein GF325_03490 [Candidatus Bathyarchaeota archaeon]|nr:hypothetical protein [Candidatus Bathyarchaeota archaeon]
MRDQLVTSLSTIELDGKAFKLSIDDRVLQRTSFMHLEESVRIGFESSSLESVKQFSTLLDRRIRATYNIDRKTITVDNKTSALF